MKILFYVVPTLNEGFYASYAYKGLQKLGHELVSIPMENAVNPETGEESTAVRLGVCSDPKWLKANGIDLILYHGFSFVNQILFQKLPFFPPEEAGIPYAVMWFDNPFRYLNRMQELLHLKQSKGLHFCCDSNLADRLAKEGFSTAYCPCMFDPDIQYPRPIKPEYNVNLAFAGSVSTWASLEKDHQKFPPELKLILDEMLAERIPGRYYDYPSMLMKKGISWYDDVFMHISFINLLEQKFLLRMELFEAVKDLGLHVWGQGDWTSDVPGVIRHGNLHQHQELPDMYASAKIQLTIELLPASVHQRIMEVAGCQGFILCEDKADMPKCFENYVVWQDVADLREKAAWYLENEGERLKLARLMHAEAMDKHRCEVRMKQVMHTLKSFLSRK